MDAAQEGKPNCFQQLKEAERQARAVLVLEHPVTYTGGSKRWTLKEERELEAACAAYVPEPGRKKWDIISAALGSSRTPISLELKYQVMVRGQLDGSGGGGGGGGGGEAAARKRRAAAAWTEEEDAALEKAIGEYVPSKSGRKWVLIAAAMPTTRTVDSVQARAKELSALVRGKEGEGEGEEDSGPPRKKKAKTEGGGGGGGGSGEGGADDAAEAGQEPKGKRKPALHWTPQEDARSEALFNAYADNVTSKVRWEEISKILGRTVIACEQRHQKLKRAKESLQAGAGGGGGGGGDGGAGGGGGRAEGAAAPAAAAAAAAQAAAGSTEPEEEE
jgi:hypothetical protein